MDFMVNISYNDRKGDDFLKRIVLLLTLLILLTTSSIALANDTKVCGVGTYSIITIPEDWETSTEQNNLYATDPDFTMGFILTAEPKKKTIDEDFQVLKTQKPSTFEVESVNKLSIDNQESLRVVLTTYNKSNIKEYGLLFVIYSTNYRHTALFMGKYEHLETDLNRIDEIASSIKVLK